MQLTCTTCSRQFDVVPEKVEGLSAVRCECGNALSLGGKGLQRLGKYLLLHKIATGGMGEIFYGVVSGVEGFEREVAIKKMLPHLNQDRSFVEMMVKEAKLTVLLNHANIVQVYDLAKEAESYYIAMEYVPGKTVADILLQSIEEKITLPVTVAVNVAQQLLRGLMYAHNLPTPSGTLSIIHRDITPQNILVTQRGVVKITDFGIARAVNEISTTSPGLIKGKLGYIAPEQLAGMAPSTQVDLFCAGIVLWEMLAGRRLFKGTSEVDTFRLISEAEVPDLRTLRGDISQALMSVVAKSLHKDPEQRFKDGDAFADALLQAMAPQTAVELRQQTEQYFKAHAQWFSDVYVHDGATPRPNSNAEITHVSRVMSLAAARPMAPPQPPPVRAPELMNSDPTLVLEGRKRGAASSSNAWAFGGAAVAAAVIAAGGIYLWRGQSTSPPPAVASLPTTDSAPSAPVPTPKASAQPNAPVASHAPSPKADEEEGEPRESEKTASPHKAARRNRRQAVAAPASDTPLTGAEIQHTVAQHQAAIARCLRGLDSKTAPKEVAAKLTIQRDGKVESVHFEPPFEGEQGKCVMTTLHALRFRKHPYEGLQVTIPLRLQVF